jgi:hypothetical protein
VGFSARARPGKHWPLDWPAINRIGGLLSAAEDAERDTDPQWAADAANKLRVAARHAWPPTKDPDFAGRTEAPRDRPANTPTAHSGTHPCVPETHHGPPHGARAGTRRLELREMVCPAGGRNAATLLDA